MDYQKELILFLEHFAPNQSQDVRDAVELDASFHVINVPKLLAVKELSENYVFRLKDSWNAWKTAKAQVSEGFVLVKMDDLELLRDSALEIKYASLNNDSDRIFSDIEDIQLSIERLIEAQEPANEN